MRLALFVNARPVGVSPLASAPPPIGNCALNWNCPTVSLPSPVMAQRVCKCVRPVSRAWGSDVYDVDIIGIKVSSGIGNCPHAVVVHQKNRLPMILMSPSRAQSMVVMLISVWSHVQKG